MSSFKFEILHQSKRSRARVGRIYTPHGTIQTPSFVAVATNGTIKALSPDIVENSGLELMFCNTYHLLLQPGVEVVEKSGGLHRFINRKLPLITDSGGFQVFSLAFGSVHEELKSQGKRKGQNLVLKVSEEGILFRSYRDGQKLSLTPESSIAAQKAIGADIIIPLDELPPYHIQEDDLKKSLARTHRWELRSLSEHLRNPKNQAIYGVVHGGVDETLRKESLSFLLGHPFDGLAIGGSVGKTKAELVDLIRFLSPQMPPEKPCHLLGIGDAPSIDALIPFGIDTFDSAYPTRAARHGLILTAEGPIKIENRKYRDDFRPIEESCDCPACKSSSRAFLNHLFKAKELSAFLLATAHNLHYMVRHMAQIRDKILKDEI